MHTPCWLDDSLQIHSVVTHKTHSDWKLSDRTPKRAIDRLQCKPELGRHLWIRMSSLADHAVFAPGVNGCYDRANNNGET